LYLFALQIFYKSLNQKFIMKKINLLLSSLCLALLIGSCRKEEKLQPASYQPQEEKLVYGLYPSPDQSLYYWADLLAQNCNASNTDYLLSAQDITWAGQSGALVYKCTADCSGLINTLVKKTYGATGTDFLNWWGRNRPIAKTYADAIAINNKFTRKSTITSIVAGDVIAVKYPEGDPTSGHVLLAASAPVLRTSSSPIISSTKQYEVEVIDCANSGHGNTDPRNIGSYSGVGRGIMRIYTNIAGDSLYGHTWSTASNSTYYGQASRKLEVGTFTP
jgi:hypothetical protein